MLAARGGNHSGIWTTDGNLHSGARCHLTTVDGAALEIPEAGVRWRVGCFALSDQMALTELIRRVVRPRCRMAEVGSWLGTGSTQVSSRTRSVFRC